MEPAGRFRPSYLVPGERIMAESNEPEMNRRNFVMVAAAAAGALAGVSGLPSALGQATTQPSTQPSAAGLFDVGLKSDYSKDGATMTWAKRPHVVIVMRENGKIYALNSRCTHKGCPVVDAGGSFHCNCHNSDFNYDGTVIDGPAQTKGPLSRYGISVDDAGHVLVDVHKKFTQAQWDDPASFVSVA
jgi:nitrite reductase/ring-hydroxylating ferredoxin subunit